MSRPQRAQLLLSAAILACLLFTATASEEVPDRSSEGAGTADPWAKYEIKQRDRDFTNAKDTIQLTILAVVAFLYQRGVSQHREPLPSTAVLKERRAVGDGEASSKDFGSPICGCCQLTPTCAWSFLGWSARMGDTLSAAGVTNFWAPWALFVVARILALLIGYIPHLIGGIPTFSVDAMQGVVCAYWRQQLRSRLGMPPAGAAQIFCDWLLYTWAPWCVTLQEAEEVDRASGNEVLCMCSVRPRSEPLVGAPRAVMD